jgi:hypothetical protein
MDEIYVKRFCTQRNCMHHIKNSVLSTEQRAHLSYDTNTITICIHRVQPISPIVFCTCVMAYSAAGHISHFSPLHARMHEIEPKSGQYMVFFLFVFHICGNWQHDRRRARRLLRCDITYVYTFRRRITYSAEHITRGAGASHHDVRRAVGGWVGGCERALTYSPTWLLAFVYVGVLWWLARGRPHTRGCRRP